ncbi:pentapeptide repeat-containing protein [Streptomyces neyagawaensis]|uniref:pentapeptide repeat-containing protein n=1 Tax=Streptomyces neyagawaensis TaxID=42238 RepID=UPI003B8A7985
MADLRGADLSAADLHEARLTGALTSEHTRWPPAFDPATAGSSRRTRGPSPRPSSSRRASPTSTHPCAHCRDRLTRRGGRGCRSGSVVDV